MADVQGWATPPPNLPPPASAPGTEPSKVSGWATPAPQPDATHVQTAGPSPNLGGSAFADFWAKAQGKIRAAKTPLAGIKNAAGITGIDSSIGQKIKSGAGVGLTVVDALFGAPQRAIAGGIAGDPTNPQNGFWTHVHQGVYGAINHDPKTEALLQTNLMNAVYGGDSAVMAQMRNPQNEQQRIENAARGLAIQVLTDPLTVTRIGMLGKLHSAGRLEPILNAGIKMLGNESLPGPMRWALSKFVNSAEALVRPARKVIDPTTGEDYIIRTGAQKVRSALHPYAKEDYMFNQSGYHTAIGVRRSGTGFAAQHNEAVMNLIRANKGALQKARTYEDIPQAVKEYTLSEGAVFGDPRARKLSLANAKKQGIDITKSDIYQKFVKMRDSYDAGELMNYKPRFGYVPNLRNMKSLFNSEFAGSDVARIMADLEKGEAEMATGRPRLAPMERGKKVDEAGNVEFPADPYEAYKIRARMGGNTMANRMMRRHLSRELGIGSADYEQDNAKLLSKVSPWMISGGKLDPNNEWGGGLLRSYMNAPHKHLLSVVEDVNHSLDQWPFFRALSNAMTRGITSNGLPHVFNVSRLSWLLGGAGNTVKGLAYAFMPSRIPAKVMDEMHKFGATTHTFAHIPDDPQFWGDLSGYMAHMVGFKQWNMVNHGMLSRVDDGLRAAAWQQLRKRYPDKDGYEIAHMVDEGLGSYMASPAYVKMLRSLGGMFPLWHLRTVPVTTIKAMLHDPQRVMTPLRADEQVNNNDVLGMKKDNEKEHFIAGSMYESTRMIDALTQMQAGEKPKYINSPSAIGSIASGAIDRLAGGGEPMGVGMAVDSAVKFAGTAAGPLGQAGEEVLNPYGSKQPLLTRLAYSVLGVYPENNSIWADKVAVYRAEGKSLLSAMETAAHDIKGMQGGGMHLPGLTIKGLKL